MHGSLSAEGARRTPTELPIAARTCLSDADYRAGEWEPMLEGALTGGSEWADTEPEANRQVAERIVELLG